MKNPTIYPRVLLALLISLAGSGVLHAATIVSGQANPQKPQLNMASVNVHYEFKLGHVKDETLACGAVLKFTDGSPEQNIAIPPAKTLYTFEKTYKEGGFFQVWLEGKTHSGLQACLGYAAVVNVFVEDVRPKVNVVAVIQPAITGLMVSGGTQPGEPTSVKVLGHGKCRYQVDFGDGRTADKDDILPVNLDTGYAITSYGNKTFALKVAGIAGNCRGAATANVTLMGPGAPAAGSHTANPPLMASPVNPSLKPNCPPGKRC